MSKNLNITIGVNCQSSKRSHTIQISDHPGNVYRYLQICVKDLSFFLSKDPTLNTGTAYYV